MRTFITVKFALAPFAVFLALLAFGMPATALVAGLALSIAVFAWRYYKHEIKSLEIGSLVIFFVLGLAYVIRPNFAGANAAVLFFVGLGLTCLITVALRKPWTADYSRSAFAQVAESPIFQAINMFLSGLWGVLFLLIALARMLHADALITTSIVVAGALVSIFGPKQLSRMAIRRAIASRETFRWPAPSFVGTNTDDDVDVAVVGAGIGGLTAAALLADAGLKVIVAEHHVVAGGFCHTYQRRVLRGGKSYLYRFDAGPHDFSGLWPGGPVDSVLQRLRVAERLDWLRLDHSYRLGGVNLDVPRDWHEYVRELGRLFPASAKGFETLFADIRAIFDGMYATGRSNGGIPGMPTTVDEMLALPRDYPLTFRWLDRPFDEFVAQHIQDPQARNILDTLSRYISDGSERLTCAQMMPMFGYYFHGGYYPAGGSGRLADVLVGAIKARGGKVLFKKNVTKIAVESDRAAGLILGDGTLLRAKAVVSNADVKRTFLELVEPHHLPADFRARIAAAQPAASAFMVHLGVDFVPDVKPAVHASGNPPVGIETLSIVDPTAAPPGHSTVGIMTLLPYAEAKLWFPAEGAGDWKEWRHSHEYEERKTTLGDRMIEAAEKVIPGLSSHIVYREEASPLTYARYDWTSAGAIYGVSREGRLRGAKSPVAGLVVAGSATHGAGVEAALISGACAADALVPGVLAQQGSLLTCEPRRASVTELTA